jgi:hypothetical protein
MVEYALVLAGSSLTSLNTIASAFGRWVYNLDWGALSYALFGLVALRIAFWAFRSDH